MKRRFICLFISLMFFQSVYGAPMWIWKKGGMTTEKVEFQKIFTLDKVSGKALLRATSDNQFSLFINGKKVASSNDLQKPFKKNIAKFLKKGENKITVLASNKGEPGGFILDLKMENGLNLVSDKNWQARAPKGQWHSALEIKPYGEAPWGKAFGNRVKNKKQKAKNENLVIATLPGFKVDKIYDIPGATQGSWVGLTSDDKGRLIACDQYGGIYRLTLGTKPLQVERLKMKIEGAHGVLYAFNSLYVFNVTEGLFRLQDTNGDDQFDSEEHLMNFKSKGEHGAHSMVLSPDKKSIYLVSGNNADLPKSVTKQRMARAWKEDHLLPRMNDGRGHNKGRLAPGGLIIKISPDAKQQELIAHGFRNPFDAAFNANGELFTFDADMEYDIGSPWYRPTRLNHVVSGADFGWRHGTGKWPVYYTDTLPSTLDVGPSSPTGMVNGLGAKFPKKYQDAIFMNDWTYGTMYAVHLEADGATYKATREEFISGKPLPLTDVIIHTDGNMYFLVGGRKTTSALYRVTYIGKESTTSVKTVAMTTEQKLRFNLEKLHLDGVGEEAVQIAWPYLSHSDRYVRYAARVAIEKQAVNTWLKHFQNEQNKLAIIEGACALARMGEKSHQALILSKLNSLDFRQLNNGHFLAALRSYQLAFTRHGKVDQALASQVVKTLDSFYPDKDNFINRELSQILLYLNAPNAVSRTVKEVMNATEKQIKLLADDVLARNDRYSKAAKRMEKYRPNTQQFALAFSLRSIKEGWNEADRATYFSWFPRAKTWQGGNSFSIFIENTRKEALANVENAQLKAKYAKASSKSLLKPRAITPPKGPGQLWTVATAVKAVENNLTARNFKSGENLFHAVACASCHRFAGQGEGIGPDLTGSVNRYSIRDMLENIIEPSKVISDQYGSSHFTMKDGSEVIGRKGTQEDGMMHLMTNPFSPDSTVEIKLADVHKEKEWAVSPMPPGLIYSLNADELSDLIAYIFSVGNAQHEYFQKKTSDVEGAQSLFNGKDLSGWKGDSKLWKVQDGVIFGSTHGNKIKDNTFLVWEGEVEDFHLTWEAKFEGNNSGMMYRAFWEDESIFKLSGYQLDMHRKPEFSGMLYGEGLGKRGIIARRGEKVEIDTKGKKKVVGKTSQPVPVKVDEWQTYEVICRDNHLIHKLNGKVTVDISDNHPEKLSKGMIGIQLHKGKDMQVWFRNIQLQKLK